VRFDVPVRVAGDLRMWIDFQLAPLRDGDGRITHLIPSAMDITARRQAEAALREADRRKDEFLATLAHELRNPLAPIRTGLDLLLRGHDDPRVLAMMNRQLTHLVHLVNDLMDVSRISRGKITLHKEHLDLAEVIRSALEMSEADVSRGERRLSLSLPPEPLPVEGDRVRLVQVFANLLHNAAKFTGEDGRIWVQAERRAEQVQVRVGDDGIGIAPDSLAQVFEPFSQVQNGRSGGLGIGLSLVRALVEMHAGTVAAQSEGPGRGAELCVSLPLSAGTAAPAGAGAAAAPAVAPGRRVLVVDDNRDIAESLRDLLTLLNADVRVAYDGAEAIRICREWLPTHVLMDLGMPGMDGYETARRLRADHPERSFRLVAISGWGQDEHRQRAQAAGFDRHLVKPVGLDEIKSVLGE
jgi:signal transduction histidine kinase